MMMMAARVAFGRKTSNGVKKEHGKSNTTRGEGSRCRGLGACLKVHDGT